MKQYKDDFEPTEEDMEEDEGELGDGMDEETVANEYKKEIARKQKPKGLISPSARIEKKPVEEPVEKEVELPGKQEIIDMIQGNLGRAMQLIDLLRR